jgi:hypothetical protein
MSLSYMPFGMACTFACKTQGGRMPTNPVRVSCGMDLLSPCNEAEGTEVLQGGKHLMSVLGDNSPSK